MSDLRERLDSAVARGAQRVPSEHRVTLDADAPQDEPTGRDTARVREHSSASIESDVARLRDALERLKEEVELLQFRLAAGSETSPYALVDQRDTQPELEPLLAVKDVAQLVGVSEKTVREWRAKGELPAPVNLGGTIRWERTAIRSWLCSRRSVR